MPTFDVGDLEKKTPEELDALLKQMDEYALKTKVAMDEYEKDAPQVVKGTKRPNPKQQT